MEHPPEEMKVLTASCFLDFSFIETTSIAYLIQDPGDLDPIPDPTHYLEQLIPPDPAPRCRKWVLSSLARLYGEINFFKKLASRKSMLNVVW